MPGRRQEAGGRRGWTNLAPLLVLALACAAPQQVPRPNIDPARLDVHLHDTPAYERRILPFPVADSVGRNLELAFLGGLNNPRPQLVDIDGDGDLDLFIQETTGRVIHFARDGGDEGLPRFRFVTDRFADLDVGEWYRFADLDGDGDFDLLAERPYSYISYYRNDGTARAPRLVLAVDTLRDASGVPIFSDRQNIPQLGDIDCNGRPDLLIGKLDGTVTRYEAVEGATLQAPVFRLLTEQFEDIRIIGQQQGSLHGANTMALVDADRDGDPDLFWGDFFEPGLLFLENTGTCGAPNLRNQPVQFPRGTPVLTSGYNAPTFGDVAGDGQLDLVMGVLGGAFNPVRTSAENLYYLDRTPDGGWRVRTRQLLPMVDIGSESVPSLVDWDGDGDVDLLLANKIDPADGRTSLIYRFENAGSAKAPAFRARGALPLRGSYHYAPAFGDLDGDGTADMILGQWLSRLAYYRGAEGMTLVDSAFITITRGSNTTPALGDLDGDGDLDLLIGEASGSLNYYRNDGTRSEPRFTLVSDEWEGVRLGRRSAPTLADLDGDGDLDLLVGWELTGVVAFRNDGSRTEPRFTKEPWFTLPVNALAAPAVGDVDGDGAPDIVVGNVGGGVVYFARTK